MFERQVIIYNPRSASGHNAEIARKVADKLHLPDSRVLNFFDVLENPKIVEEAEADQLFSIGGDGSHGTNGEFARNAGLPFLPLDGGSVSLFPHALGFGRKPWEGTDQYLDRVLKAEEVVSIQPGKVSSRGREQSFMGTAGVGILGDVLRLVEEQRKITPERLKRLLAVAWIALSKQFQDAPIVHLATHDVSEATILKYPFTVSPHIPLSKYHGTKDLLITLPSPEDRNAVYSAVLRVLIDFLCLHLTIRPVAKGIVVSELRENETVDIQPDVPLHIDTELVNFANRVRIKSQVPNEQPYLLMRAA